MKVTSFNDLFGNTDTISESRISNDVREIPLTELYEFKNHPFHADADKLEEMAGLRTTPMVIKNLSDDEATIVMIEQKISMVILCGFV